MRWIICFVSVALAVTCGAGDAAAQDARTYSLTPKVSLRVAGPWVESPVKYSNATEFVVKGEVRVPTDRPGGEQSVEFPLARLLVTTEPRGSHADALKRLDDIAASRPEQARFVEIGGWPALELEFFEALPRRGQQAGTPNEIVRRAITAIAADDEVLNFDISLVQNAPADLLRAAQEVARNVSVSERPNPDAVRQEIERLQQTETARKGQRPQPRGDLAPDRGSQETRFQATRGAAPGDTGAVAVQTGVGEIEIATSADGRNVVIAANGGLSSSTDRGATYDAATSGVFGLNDPSVARAVSGNFYLAVIAFPTGAAGQLGVTGCTNAVSRSTNKGANFTLQGYSARCPQTGAGLCFPDQEHLAADAFTAGNDQLYAVWRNFTPAGPVATCRAIGGGFVTPAITCSQDNGVNWTAMAAIAGTQDFPRVATARDGTVYVVSLSGNSVLLNRFSSCATGLTPATGFPVTVATLSGGVTCPMPGLDRCNDGNTLSSPTVAPDPGNVARVFVTFAENDGSGGERVVTRESTNSGASFGGPATLSGSSSARRFMPWSCVTRGRAWVGWYDRSAANAAGATNDLTEYFLGATKGPVRNLSNNPDPQCASGWPLVAPRSMNDSESCSVQPQLAGVCQRVGGGGSGNRCDFSAGGCPAGETCQTGGGRPKYGDYNGIACAENFVTAAWTSATAPAGLPAATGLGIFSSTVFVEGDIISQPRAVLNDFAYEAGGWRVDKHLRLLGDVNGDGRTDIVAFGDEFVFVALGRADGGGWRLDKHVRLLGDVNGDGRADIVAFGDQFVFVALGRADGGFDPPRAVLNDFAYEAGGWRVDKHLRLLGDVNGDGRIDIVAFGDQHVFVALGRADGGFDPPRAVLNDLAYEAGGWRIEKHPRLLGDVNGDGRADIVAFGDEFVFVALGRADGGFDPPQPVINDLAYEAGGWRVEKHPRLLGDVNGDGRTDIVAFGDEFVFVALGQFDAGGWRIEKHPRLLGDVNGDRRTDIVAFGDQHVFVARGRLDGGFDPPQPVLNDLAYEAGGWRVTKHPRLLGDVNGDGRADIVAFGDQHVFVALGRADGGFDPPRAVLNDLAYEAGGWRVTKHPRLLGDVNGDGRADIVAFGDQHVFVALGRADGGFDPPQPVINDLAYEAGGWRVTKHPRLLGDVNGGGHTDIVAFGDRRVFVARGRTDGGFDPPQPVINDLAYEAGD